MSYVAAEELIRDRMLTWTRTEIAWDGMFNSEYDPEDQVAFCRPNVLDVASDQRSFRSNSHLVERDALLNVEFFFPSPWSDNPTEVAQHFMSLFRAHEPEDLWFFEPSMQVSGNIQDDIWYQVTVTIPFKHVFRPVLDPEESFEAMVFTQASHGFSSWDAIRRTSTGWTKALGDSSSNYADAVVGSVSGEKFSAFGSGFAESSNHGFTVGSNLYLSTGTAGLLSTSQPAAGSYLRVGRVISDNQILIDMEWI